MRSLRGSVPASLLLFLLTVGLVSGGLLDYYGRINTSVNIEPSILVDGVSWTVPIEKTITPPTVGINNPQSAGSDSLTGTPRTITLSSYTVPSDVGSDLILVVWVQAEYRSHSEAASAKFDDNAMTKITGASTCYQGTGSNYTGGAMFWKAVSPGDSGNIVATFPGKKVDSGSIHALTLSNVDTSGPKAATCNGATSSPFYTSLSGLTAGDMVISGGTNGRDVELVAYGDGHIRDSSQVPTSCAGAQGHKEVTGTSSGDIGWSTDDINRGIVSLVAFTRPEIKIIVEHEIESQTGVDLLARFSSRVDPDDGMIDVKYYDASDPAVELPGVISVPAGDTVYFCIQYTPDSGASGSYTVTTEVEPVIP